MIGSSFSKFLFLLASAERFCHVIVTDLRDAAVTGFTVIQPFDRNENGIDRWPEILESWSNNPTSSPYIVTTSIHE